MQSRASRQLHSVMTAAGQTAWGRTRRNLIGRWNTGGPRIAKTCDRGTRLSPEQEHCLMLNSEDDGSDLGQRATRQRKLGRE